MFGLLFRGGRFRTPLPRSLVSMGRHQNPFVLKRIVSAVWVRRCKCVGHIRANFEGLALGIQVQKILA